MLRQRMRVLLSLSLLVLPLMPLVAGALAPDADLSPAAIVTVHVDRAQQIGVSQLALGVTHTQESADSWNDPGAVTSARQVLRSASIYQNQRLMGWGALNPE